jgi:hypothetical protein
MAQTTAGLPNGGQTYHYAVSYDEGLTKDNGQDLAIDLINFLDDDLSLIIDWFAGVTYQFSFPINVQITGNSNGASWTDEPNISLPYNPTVVLGPGPNPTTGLLRYLVVSEVTEMYMASQRQSWYETTYWYSGADEGSMGESLSRFLASQFLVLKDVSTSIFSGFSVVPSWLNAQPLANWIDTAPDDNQPDPTTGCGTCFLFFLHDQLNLSIQQIISANGTSLADIYQSLTTKSDAWQSFRNLVQDHYPPSSGPYHPPLDNVFPVGELNDFLASSPILSWISNDPNVAVVILHPAAPIPVDVTLTSDDPKVISIPATVKITSSGVVNLNVKQQAASFLSETVHLTASYAGQMIKLSVKVVRPEDLPLPPLIIKPLDPGDPCSKSSVAGTSQTFYVANPNVIHDPTGLTYKWTVTGAAAPQTNQSTLTIPSLPAAGTDVTVSVEIKNTYGIHAIGSLEFGTTSASETLDDLVRELECRVSRYKLINKYIPPWVPIEINDPAATNGRLARLEAQAKQQVKAATGLIASIEKVKTAIEVA